MFCSHIAKKILTLVLVFCLSGADKVIAADSGRDHLASDSVSEQKELQFTNSLSQPLPTSSLSSTLQNLEGTGINPNSLKTFFQQNTFAYKGAREAQQMEVVQGYVTLDEFVEVLAKLQEDFIRMLQQNPNMKFQVKVLENEREISKEIPAKFFLALLREANLLEYERIQNNSQIQKLLSESKEARKLIEAQFTSNFDKTNVVTKTEGDNSARIYFAIFRFTGNMVTKPVLSMVISTMVLGTAISTGLAFGSVQFIQDLSVQGMMSAFGMSLALFGSKYAQWLDSGFPNPGNVEFNVYLRWWMLEGIFLTILPIAYFMWGIYPEQSLTTLMIEIWFKTAVLSTLSQGLWEIIIAKYYKKDASLYEKAYEQRLKNYKEHGLKTPALMLLSDPSFLDKKEKEIGKLLRAEEVAAKRSLYAALAYNSIVSVTLASLQATAEMQGIEYLVQATNIGFGVYIASAVAQMLNYAKSATQAERLTLRKIIWDTAKFLVNPVKWFQASVLAIKSIPALFTEKGKLEQKRREAESARFNSAPFQGASPQMCMALFR